MGPSSVITVTLNPSIDRLLEVPNFSLGAHQIGRQVSRLAAGKGVNVSKVLATLGVTSIATGFLGQDNRRIFDEVLADAGVADEFFELPGPTRENITISDPVAGNETHIRDAGLAVDRPHVERLMRKLKSLARPNYLFIFSGSLPPGVTNDDLRVMVDNCLAAGCRVAVDVAGSSLRTLVQKPLWLVKPNEAELAELAGQKELADSQLLGMARDMAQNIEIVLISQAERGAILVAGDLALHAAVPPEQAKVRHKVGCGDVLLAVFIACMLKGAKLREALVEAVAYAAASACTTVTAGFDKQVAAQMKTMVDCRQL